MAVEMEISELGCVARFINHPGLVAAGATEEECIEELRELADIHGLTD